MSSPPPGAPKPAARPVPSRVIVESTSRRDTLIAVGIGLAVLALVAWGISLISRMPGQPSTNKLTGTIVAKHDSGMQEREINFNKKGMKALETDSGYSFDVRTDPEGRVYEVPVPKVQYGMYEVGAKYSFIRPPSEQR